VAKGVGELMEQPLSRWLLLFLALFALFFQFDLSGGKFAQVFLPAAGFEASEPGAFFDRSLVAIVLAAGLTLNFVLALALPFKAQIGMAWVELLIAFLAFFYSFDLSYPFIVVRLPILIFTGAFTTIYISMISIGFACVLALIGALARLSKMGLAYGVATFYISFFRGTPLLLQVYIIYLGLPQMGIILDPVPAGIIALSLCYGAYMAEIFRAGIQGVPKGQAEAATALGLRPGLTMRKVILPQAMKLIVPPTGNQFIAMLKDSSLVSVLGVQELMFLARTQGRSEFKHFEMLITAAIIYWIISIGFELIQARIEAYYSKGDVR
jgi:polar amino acid transport system permease protein